MSKLEFENNSNGKKYKVEGIYDSTMFIRVLEGHLPGIYYLIFWKGYLEENNTWGPALAI